MSAKSEYSYISKDIYFFWFLNTSVMPVSGASEFI